MMNREEECVCCHEILQVRDKNDEVFEYMKPREPYTCVTDNSVFKTGCLDRWVLQIAWLQYKQEYGRRAYEGPEHKVNRHVAYRQFVCWCWGVLGLNIRVVLPPCVVSCIQAHFPPPGDEDDFVFVGFRFADE